MLEFYFWFDESLLFIIISDNVVQITSNNDTHYCDDGVYNIYQGQSVYHTHYNQYLPAQKKENTKLS